MTLTEPPALVLFLLVDTNKHLPTWLLGSEDDDGVQDMNQDSLPSNKNLKKFKGGDLTNISAILMCEPEMEVRLKQAIMNVSQDELHSLMKAVLSVECLERYVLVSFYFNDPDNLKEETFTQMQRLAEITIEQIIPNV